MTDSTIPDATTPRPTLMQERLSRLSVETASSSNRSLPADQSPIVGRELLVLPLIVILCDFTIYRGHGYTGLGLLFSVAPVLLFLGIVGRRFDVSSCILLPLLMLTSLRLVWCGSVAAVVAGFVLLCGFAMSLSGLRPHVLQSIVFAAHLIPAGHRGLHLYSRSLSRFSPKIVQAHLVAVLLPVATLFVFGTIFILANPDLVRSFSSGLTHFVDAIQSWMSRFEALEVVFCIAILWLGVGLLRPDTKQVSMSNDAIYVSVEPATAPLYEAFRNTLVMVIGLFAVYLIFEFQTLWFRVFPKGFHYSGYAHEGAAWLTVALGLATLLLSVIFRGRMLDDPRLPKLRRLSWIWSLENLLLAVAVFNRLFIYVGFNGMTRMRVIGLLGAASVVFGFLLVLRKIARNYDFTWLIRRQLWTVTFAAYLYAILPVDAFVNRYNVGRILSGDSAPSVQISVHPTTSEGLLQLRPLIHCDDPIIQQGIRAMLANKLIDAESQAESRRQRGWSAYQMADDRLLSQLRSISPQLETSETKSRREELLKRFHEYAYQWF
ncbi:MAG: hypothetical protein JWP89_4749 [Schlesneria sp.]|nr:hypothetical protein [Schlesneria sp.]